MIYKITFNMCSPIVFNDLPIFDSIISYCVYKSKYRQMTDYKTPTGVELKNVEKDIPLILNKNGFFECSYMLFDNSIEFIEKWRKKWYNKNDNIVDFGCSKKRIHISSGKYKSYEIPLLCSYIDKVYFFFNGFKDEIESLIKNNLVGIGKKTSIGFGWFNDFIIEKVNDSYTKYLYYRALPKNKETLKICNDYEFQFSLEKGSYKLPYWNYNNYELIIKPIKLK